jgi:hypothetical protein
MKFLKEQRRGGEFHTLFPQLMAQPCKFYDYFRMLPETFWYILNDIRDDIKNNQIFGSAYLLRKD